MKTLLITLFFLFLFVSCSGKGGGSDLSSSFMGTYNGVAVQGITLDKGTLRVKGSDLLKVNSVKVVGKNNTQVETVLVSKKDNELTANLVKNIALAAGEAFSVVINTAAGDSIIDAVFTIYPNSIPIKSIQGVLGSGGKSGDTLIWDTISGSWKTTPFQSQVYLGALDASVGGSVIEVNPIKGDYYYVTVAGARDLNSTGDIDLYVGDKVIFNGESWDVIKGSTGVTSFNRRSGDVFPHSGDYSWEMLSRNPITGKVLGSKISEIADVDFTKAPQNGEYLMFNGSKWIPQSIAPPIQPVISLSDVVGLSSALNSKENLLPASGKGGEFLSGNKVFRAITTNDVSEGSSLYFTDARARTAVAPLLNSYVTNLGLSQSLSNYISSTGLSQSLSGYITSSQLNLILAGYQTTFDYQSLLSQKANTSDVASSLSLKLDKTGGVVSGDLEVQSLKLKNGGSSITLSAPSGISAYGLTLPTTAGSSGQVLTTNGSGALSWVNPSNATTATKESIGLGNVQNIDTTNRSNHIGTQAASTISDFSTETMSVINNTALGNSIGNIVNQIIDTTDSIPSAIAKLQGQISSIKLWVESNLSTKANARDLNQEIVTGNIVIGSPLATNLTKLDVNGSAITRTFTYSDLPAGGSTIDLTKSNSIAVLSESCPSTCPTDNYYSVNVGDGASYTLAFQNTDRTWIPHFNFKTQDGSLPLTNVRYSQPITARTDKHLIIVITRIGDVVYVASSEI